MIYRFTILVYAFLLSLQVNAQESEGFLSVTNLNQIPITKDTGEKPQSKVWSYACTQWTVLADADGTHLWRLDDTKWSKVLTLTKAAYKADCKVKGNAAHIILFTGKDTSYLISLEHVPMSNTYKFWSKRPEPVGIELDKGAVTATIDIDSKGRMWLASNAGTEINVHWSDAPYSKWSKPVTIATGVAEDDICGVIAMPGKIGVLWSDQNTQRFGFKIHVDGSDPTDWSADEVPASQSAQDINMGMAKPYLNLAIAKDGTLYCAVRTGYNTKELPRVSLLKRNPAGDWDDLYLVSNSGSRPIVILNDTLERLKVIYTTSAENGNNIVYKESSTSEINFSSELLLMKGPYNDATSSKDNYTSSVVILASNETHAVSVLASDGIPAETCPMYIDWQAYPNPFKELTNITFTLTEDSDYILNLYDSKGTKVTEIKRGTAIAGEPTIVEVNGSNLDRGLYFIRLQTGNSVKSIKVIREK